MATRRQKLRDIFRYAADNGETAQDLLDRIEAFTAAGKSGIEPFIDETLADYASEQAVGVTTFDQEAAVGYLKQALALLDR